jgi:hypothetical protein
MVTHKAAGDAIHDRGTVIHMLIDLFIRIHKRIGFFIRELSDILSTFAAGFLLLPRAFVGRLSGMKTISCGDNKPHAA